MQQNIALSHCGEHIRRRGGFDVRKSLGGLRDEPRLLQVVAIERDDGPQPREVKWSRQVEDLMLVHVEFAHEQCQDMGVDGLLDLETYGRAEPAAHEFPFEGEEQVLCVVLLHLDIFITSDSE
ncbi:unannotated protein [freshwater metagenome]|uniref:Unannotated protein n=1 Tax=freshwater metagenome TaxID=449393 RepID=A0A6J7HX72_9ZZZZ